MGWYLQLIDFLLLGFLLIMGRHLLLRGRYFLHIFQQNGYKFGEYRDWLIEYFFRRVITAEHMLFNIVIAAMIVFLSNTLTGSSAVIIMSAFAAFWFIPFNYYTSDQSKKPLAFTPRMIRLAIPFVIFILLLPVVVTYFSYTGHIPLTNLQFQTSILYSADIYLLAFGWIVADVLVPFFIFLAAFITKPYENYVHRYFIRQAQKKLAQMPDLTVIAVTGSYGKTSTKFMIRDLLDERYSVCATPGSYNTPMGICKVINNDLNARHQVLVLEMGARYEGNISKLCDIAEPDISVVTNVGVAHLETFGSQDAIARTKSTIVQRTKPEGTAILNADDQRVANMGNLGNDLQIITAGLKSGNIKGSDIKYSPDGMQFTVTSDGGSESFNMQLLGAHNVQNILLAIGVGKALGLRLSTMSTAAERIEPVEHRLEIKNRGRLTIIDDAFNANPVGAKNAVETLAQFNSEQRIIITPGMIELGDLQQEKNYEFGQQIGQAGLELVILVGTSQTEAIRQGIASTDFDMKKVQTAKSLDGANRIMQEAAEQDDVVLYENDLPDSFDE